MLGKKVKINFKNKDVVVLLQQFDGEEGIIKDFNSEKIFVNFVDNDAPGLAFNIEDVEVYLTGKRPIVWLHKDTDDMMNNILVCRNCGEPVTYGKSINNTGHTACPDCSESLRINIDKTRSEVYQLYANNELHLYVMSEKDYKAACDKLLNTPIEKIINDQRLKVKDA